LLLFSSWIFTWQTPAIAGILKIETQTTVEVSENLLKTSIILTNNGTASASNLQVHLRTLGEQQDSPIIKQLNPGQSDRVHFEREIPEMMKGRYPLTVYVDFHDANQYPFSALSGMTFHIKKDVNPNLVALVKDITIKKIGELRFDIKNMGFKSKKLLASLILPKELSTPRTEINVQIDARSEKDLRFKVNNFSALPGARYPVFCYLEYVSDETHHTAVARSLVKIAEDENLFRRFRWLWIVLTVILCAVLFIVILKDRKKRIKA